MNKLAGIALIFSLFIIGCASTPLSNSGARLTIYDPSPLDKFIIENAESPENLISAQQMIDSGHRVNRSVKNYYTPVVTAIGENKLEFLKLLLKNGGKLNNVPEFYGTQNIADIAISPETLEILEANGIAVTPKHFAISYVYTGDIVGFKKIIKSGEVSIGDTDYKGRNFSLIAADGEQLEMFTYLMRVEAPFTSVINGAEHTPFSVIGRKQKDFNQARAWLDKISKHHYRNIPCGDLPLDADQLELFIDKGAKIVCQNSLSMGSERYDYNFFNSFITSFNIKTCNQEFDVDKLSKSYQLKCLADNRPYIFTSFLNAQSFDTSMLSKSTSNELGRTLELLEKVYETEFYSGSSSFLHDYTKELVFKKPNQIVAESRTFELIAKMARNINIQDAEGNTALHYVQSAINYSEFTKSKNKSLALLKQTLLSKRADKTVQNNEGLSIVDLEGQLDNYRKFGSIYPPNIENGSQESKFNWMKALASTVGFVAGGGLELDTEAQVRAISGIFQDSQPGVEGVSNTVGALNNAAARYEANSKSPLSGATTPDLKARGKKQNYFKFTSKPSLVNCGLSDPQVNSMCLTANKYYERYKVVSESGQNGDHLYKMHEKTARQLIDWLRRSKPNTVLDLDTPSNGRYVKQKKNNYTVVNKPVEACANPVERCVTGPNGKSCWTDCGKAVPVTGNRAGSVRE